MIYNINFKTGKLEAAEVPGKDKNNLPVGTVLHLNGYNCPDYVITENKGFEPSQANYGASYSCVNLDTGEDFTKQAYSLMWEKDKKDNRIQVYITDRIMDKEEMTWALIAATAIKAENDRKVKEAEDKRAKDKTSLPGRFPYLKPGSGVVCGAANIRIELKKAFPSIKFTVKSEHRGSSSINIGWTDGPTTEQVKEITGKYSEGNFNGMEDIYEYGHHVWPEVFGGARYVSEYRQESPNLIAKAAGELGYKFEAVTTDNYGRINGLDDDRSQMIYRKARQTAA